MSLFTTSICKLSVHIYLHTHAYKYIPSPTPMPPTRLLDIQNPLRPGWPGHQYCSGCLPLPLLACGPRS